MQSNYVLACKVWDFRRINRREASKEDLSVFLRRGEADGDPMEPCQRVGPIIN